ncbi:hypothetical protein KTG15_12645 [Methanobacterium sp. YSL]|nr:hypothetical protein [Methanobacterium sp. YSL]
MIGKGEAAAIVMAKTNSGTLASNNIKDVKYYVDLYQIHHITTHDIMDKAVQDGILTVEGANEIWLRMILKKRRLPYPTYIEYLNSKIENKV